MQRQGHDADSDCCRRARAFTGPEGGGGWRVAGPFIPLDVHEFRVLGQDYDPENPGREATTYYRTIDGAERASSTASTFRHGHVTLFHEVPAQVRRACGDALALASARSPRNGNECVGARDSAAAVYVTGSAASAGTR